jgi:hypothetical protein
MFVGFTSYCNEDWVSFQRLKPLYDDAHGHKISWKRVYGDRNRYIPIETLSLDEVRALARTLQSDVRRLQKSSASVDVLEFVEIKRHLEHVSMYLQYKTIAAHEMTLAERGDNNSMLASARECAVPDMRAWLLELWTQRHANETWHRRYTSALRRFTMMEEEGEDEDEDEWMICPITREVMEDPVVCVDGHTYERYAIQRWLASSLTSPNTGARLRSAELTPNHALRKAVRARRAR